MVWHNQRLNTLISLFFICVLGILRLTFRYVPHALNFIGLRAWLEHPHDYVGFHSTPMSTRASTPEGKIKLECLHIP